MTHNDRETIFSPGEEQVLEHPATLKVALFVLIPFITLFDFYVAMSGRVWAAAVLSLQLLALVFVALVLKSRIRELKKILIYRYVFRVQILVYGIFMLVVVGVFHQIEVSPWAFVYIFLVSIWRPDRWGILIVLVFNLCLATFFLATDMADFLIHQEYYIRFYIALVVFSLLAMSMAVTLRTYFTKFFAARDRLKESESRYRSLSRTLKKEIEHRDKIEKRLHHAIKMETLGRVAAGVAHDLNNILSGIVTYPDLMLLDMDRDHPLRDPLETVKASGIKAAAIVDDLLVLSRRGVGLSEPVDLRNVAASYLNSPEHRQFMASHGAVAIESEYEKGVKAVIGSPVHLHKTVMNLVTNSVEALSGDGRIMIQVKNRVLEAPQDILHPVQGFEEIPAGEYVEISISDTGMGIDPKDLGLIFEPFFTRKEMGRSGTGLGMALVLGTVNDHQGFVQISSLSGQGTHVSLYFPAVDLVPEGADGPDNPRIDPAGNLERILVIDDEPVQLNIARRLLMRLGYRVDCCASGEEGLEFLKENTMDLVMVDIIMEPGMDGVETCERVLEQKPDQRILFATGFSDTATLNRARSLGRGDCLFKPYTLKEIAAMVRERLSAD